MISLALGGALDGLAWLIVVPFLLFLGYRTLDRSHEPGKLLLIWIVSAALILLIVRMTVTNFGGPYTLLFVLFPAVILAIFWAPIIGRLAAKPLTDTFMGGDEVADLKPFYYLAEGRRRQGQFDDAIAEVRKQLENFPGDPAGYMMLATIQAEDKHDLPAAEATVEELLAQPSLPPQAAVSALHALADWQLQFGRNTPAAHAALERVLKLFPNSQFAHAAQQRIAHLGGVDQTREFRENAKFAVQARLRKIGLEKTPPPEPPAVDDEALVANYVKQLEQFPADTEAREHLAILYAEKFQRLDLAAEQLEQLINVPDETPRHVAHWLDLLATLHIRCAKNRAGAENALRRIIERFPQSSMAGIATARLASLSMEMKAGEQSEPKRMGVYEKNLGLKKPAA
jgi:tetratricopeptide (TPR) repeat protein